MRIILAKDVARLGAEGDVVEVAGGFARNYLLPRQLAIHATRGALRDLERRRASLQAKRAGAREVAQALVERIHANPITIIRKAGDEGRLHGSITAPHVAELIKSEIGVELDRKQIELHEPIRRTGSYLVTVRPHHDVAGELALTVASEAAPEEAEDQAADEEQATEEAADEEQVEGEDAQEPQEDAE